MSRSEFTRSGYSSLARGRTRGGLQRPALIITIAFVSFMWMRTVGNTLTSSPPGQTVAGPTALTTAVRHGLWTHLKLPIGTVNLASRQAGAWATASSTAEGFTPSGAIDGDWTAQHWGKGHGWQNAKRHEYPSWLEIRLPHEEEIDTIVIQTFPEVMRGVNWMGIRNADIEVKQKGEWQILTSYAVRGNIKGTIVLPFRALRTDSVRIVVLGSNTGQQEDVFYDDDDFARVLQVGLYRLNTPYLFVAEDVSVRVERGPQGSVAIYRDELPIKPANPSSPEYLASVLRKAGYGVTFLDSKALCVSEILDRQNFDVFVDPYGAPFPVETMLYDFLASGGHLITVGGHPFRRALMFSPEGKIIDGGYDLGITTTVARRSDYNLPYREQFGLFYTGYQRFEDVAYVKPSPGQNVTTTPFKVNAHLEGEVAAAFVGERHSVQDAEHQVQEGTFPAYAYTAQESLSHLAGVPNFVPGGLNFNYLNGYVFNWPRARWIPLINAYDRLGRLRGSVLTLLDNFRGPYRGSGWIFCGVENEDLFSPQHPEFIQALLDGLRYLHAGLGLHDVLPEMDCYYQGEAAQVAATLENYASAPRRVAVDFQLIPSGAKSPAFEKRLEVEVPPGSSLRPSVSWKPVQFDSDLYLIRVTLSEGGRQMDTAESAFVVWDPKVIAQGPRVDFHDSYFHVGGRPQLLIGTRTMGFQPHGQVDEDVLGIDRQFAEMHEHGMKATSPVLFDFYISGLAWGEPGTPALPLQLQRQMDAQVQLAQKHHLIIAPDIFFMAKYMAMERPEFSRRICEELGKRYASVPGIMFYIFDDGWSNTPLQPFRDWSRSCVEGFSSSGRRYLVFAQSYGLAMERYGTDALTMPVNEIYSPGQPAAYRVMDMRAAGKSFHIEEFGVFANGAKPSDVDFSNSYNSGSPAGAYSVYLMEPHLFFATGGSYLSNWVWKDAAQLIFPWGVTNANDYTPVEHLIAYRNESWFLGHFQPKFVLPKVLVVISKVHVLKDDGSFVPYLQGTMNALFERATQFAVIDDVDLDRLPNGPHVLIYPNPEYVSPDVVSKLRSRVEAGDNLYMSGDFTQSVEEGGNRRTELFTQLLGLRWLSDYPPNSDTAVVPTGSSELVYPYLGHPLSMFRSVDANVLATDSQGHALVAIRQIGTGHVLYTPDVSVEGTQRALHTFLETYGVPSTALSPQMPNRDIFEIDRVDGGKTYTLVATRPDRAGASVNGPWIEHPESFVINVGGKDVHLPLGVYGVSLFAVRENGAIDALEGQGKFSVDGIELLDAQPHVMAMSLDDVALTKSHAVAILPIGAGKISIVAPPDVDVVEVGEPGADAQFHPLEEIATSRQDGRLVFQIDDVQSRGLLLITSKSNRDHARQLMDAALQ